MKFMSFKMLSYLLILLFLGSCGKGKQSTGTEPPIVQPPKDVISISHPCMLHSDADFTFVKSKLDALAQPWKSGYDVLAASTFANENYTPSPVVILIRGGNSNSEPNPDNYTKAYRDVAAAYQLALRWKLTGNTIYADKAIQILNVWANTCTGISGDSNRFLASGLYGYQFANAAEIMRSYSGWQAADITKFKNWMVNLWYPIALDFLKTHNGACDSHYWANWDIANMNTVLAIGILTDDLTKINYAIEYFKFGVGNGNIDKAVVTTHYVNGEILGQCQESGRDQGHATLVISLFGSFCQMAKNIGVDLFGYKNNKVLAMCEYVAKYNVDFANTVPYQAYKNCSPISVSPEQTIVSSYQRGTLRPSWELIYNHYKSKGVQSKYSQQFAEKVRPEGGGGNYGPNSGGFDQLGFGTLMFTK